MSWRHEKINYERPLFQAEAKSKEGRDEALNSKIQELEKALEMEKLRKEVEELKLELTTLQSTPKSCITLTSTVHQLERYLNQLSYIITPF